MSNSYTITSNMKGRCKAIYPALYELKIDGGVIGIIDVSKKNVWIYNDLDKDMKLIIASVSSAILMRKLDEGQIGFF